ncbi:hypothetical protein GOQ30_18025 [Flavobacterium sp. TP390]|uniref:Uncharacterized protein n=1 Tax=Flavobacterium profundi TaxID=1774945 RepID=A0A6I4IVT7_9FLAO|nr:hypothetical protein [Flavobacterium profundi]MVO11072.1 hypothetical protein [Flavobacterium profundi]
MKNIKNPKENEIESNLKDLNYPASEDIYNQDKKEMDVDPEDPSKVKKNPQPIDKTVTLGADLDVPGASLDDQQEAIGSEDEENNYYSQADTK